MYTIVYFEQRKRSALPCIHVVYLCLLVSLYPLNEACTHACTQFRQKYLKDAISTRTIGYTTELGYWHVQVLITSNMMLVCNHHGFTRLRVQSARSVLHKIKHVINTLLIKIMHIRPRSGVSAQWFLYGLKQKPPIRWNSVASVFRANKQYSINKYTYDRLRPTVSYLYKSLDSNAAVFQRLHSFP